MLLRLKIEFFDKIEQKMRDGDGDGDGRRWDADKIEIFTVNKKLWAHKGFRYIRNN